MKKNAPPPPDILRKSGPHKDKKKYDRKRSREEDRRKSDADLDSDNRRPS